MNIKYKHIKIKQHSQVTYLWYKLEETKSDEPVTLKVINKINRKLELLYRKIRHLTNEHCIMFYNDYIQPHFDNALSVWYPNLNGKTKQKIQIVQNKYIRFCLKLDISEMKFRLITLLPTSKRTDQFINNITYNFFNKPCPYYLSESFEFATHCR